MDRVTEPLSDDQVLGLANQLAGAMSRTAPFPDSVLPDVSFSTLEERLEK